MKQYGELTAIQKGLWSVNTELLFDDDFNEKDTARISNHGKDKIVTQSIDNLEIETGTDVFIKMDIEGFELDALRGAEKLIRERKPSLAICVYHKEDDIVVCGCWPETQKGCFGEPPGKRGRLWNRRNWRVFCGR